MPHCYPYMGATRTGNIHEARRLQAACGANPIVLYCFLISAARALSIASAMTLTRKILLSYICSRPFTLVQYRSSSFSANLTGRSSVAMTLHALLFIIASTLFLWRKVSRKRPSRPPGPAGYPFVGNLFDMPLGGWEWKTFTRWAEQYGTFVS